MITADTSYSDMLVSPARELKGRVELYDGSTLLNTFNYDDALVSFEINRAGEEGKFFGYGICQMLTVVLNDIERAINISKENKLEVAIGVGSDYLYPTPVFFVDDIQRDENTNQLTITAYDAIYRANYKKLSEVTLPTSYTIEAFTNACAALLGMPVKFENVIGGAFDTLYEDGANFSGGETVRDALNDVAEATQTIYFMNNNWELTFKRLDKDGDPVLNVDKSQYFTLNSRTDCNLEKIVSTTELGDNVYVETGVTGVAQYIRDNAFWSLREDLDELLTAALGIVGGLTINQFDCEWRGNPLLEITDKVSFVTKDDQIIYTYLLNDVITYNGGLKQHSQWTFADNKTEDLEAPITLKEALNHTYAKVDKINREITLVASNVEANAESISSLSLTTEDITASVQQVETTIQEGLDSINGELTTLSQRVDLGITAEDVQIAINNELSNGIDKVTTSTGYTFDQDGLTVSKSDSEITTTISEDGMNVSRSGEVVLTANNEGVQAEDLHATTYLIIGLNSRFEDYLDNRTGCFFIG